MLKNAGEGIDALGPREEKRQDRASPCAVDDGFARIIASATTARAFPSEDRHKLIEPYVTTRAEGTGLGLPIVIKIFEDHHGEVELLDGLAARRRRARRAGADEAAAALRAVAAAGAPIAARAPGCSHTDRPS